MKYSPLIGLLLLTGCNHKGLGLTSSTPSTNGQADIIAGQSNAERFNVPYLQDITGVRAINIAVGNTPLSRWSKGGDLYQNLVNTARAQKKLRNLYFYQGEYEAKNGDANTWAQRFTQMVRDFRADIGNPDIKIYFFRINVIKYSGYGPNWELVRAQQDSVSISGVEMISSDGCELSIDELHYTVAGYKCLADRLAIEIEGV